MKVFVLRVSQSYGAFQNGGSLPRRQPGLHLDPPARGWMPQQLLLKTPHIKIPPGGLEQHSVDILWFCCCLIDQSTGWLIPYWRQENLSLIAGSLDFVKKTKCLRHPLSVMKPCSREPSSAGKQDTGVWDVPLGLRETQRKAEGPRGQRMTTEPDLEMLPKHSWRKGFRSSVQE